MTRNIWGIHMKAINASDPIDNGFIAIGWDKMGDLRNLEPNREAFKEHYKSVFNEEKMGAIPVKAGVLFRFLHDMDVGDHVVFPSKKDRMVYIGIIEGEYSFKPEQQYPHQRRVKWIRKDGIPRTEFTQTALYEIGSAITLFLIAEHVDEFLTHINSNESAKNENNEIMPDDENATAEVSKQIEEGTEDFIIKQLKSKLLPKQFEEFVAHLLKCMGYFSRVTQASNDGGIDVIAHKDELGFEPPIIKVQCKHTLHTIHRPDIQQLSGAIQQNEHGLFVTLGAYSNGARVFEQTAFNLRLIDGRELVELILSHYNRFEAKYKILLPLRKAFIPSPFGTLEEFNEENKIDP